MFKRRPSQYRPTSGPTKTFRGQTLSGLSDHGGRARIQDLSFTACTFEACVLSMTDDLARIAEVRRVELIDCTENGCHIGPIILSEVKVSGLRTNDLFIMWCPYLDRVTMSGDIGRIKINSWAGVSTFEKSSQQPFEQFRKAFYSKVEWALDISKARFREFDISGVPGRLVRRDPESQVLITRERASEVAIPGWETKLDPSNDVWPYVIRAFLRGGNEDTVLVAPLAAPKGERDPLLRGLMELRRIGLAEPD